MSLIVYRLSAILDWNRCRLCSEFKPIAEFYNQKSRCKVCDIKRVREWQSRNKERLSARKIAIERELRRRVIQLFGGCCKVCGFMDIRALQLDHIRGNGSLERKQLSTYGVYRKALREPEGYQLLCANHNLIKSYENGER